MIKTILGITGIIFFTIVSIQLHAQGCSDAGVCTLNSIRNNTQHGEQLPNILSFGFGFGKGEDHVSNYTTDIQYTRQITKAISITGKIDYSFISGVLANTNGLGDLTLSATHSFDTKKAWKKSFIVGLKIPFDDADITKNGIHLPMPYQTSLGTTDLILGINFMHRSFGATIAVQQPLKPINENQFLPTDYPSKPAVSEYLPTNKFGRKGDILLRLSYNHEINKKFSVRPSLLTIYHEANDTYVDDAGNRRQIALSKGFTLNANVFLEYKVSKTSSFELSLATPFVVRENRPDGLTRSFVTSLEYRIGF